ncbi:MAG: hypothetical protein K0U98_05355 [Deltaproteobacteria bacterium]|nr:hypothetical protein [Deltaproteobacteria bacterium]
MANLTVAIEEGVLRSARIRALQQGTSVNALLREYLESYAGADSRQRVAANKILERASRIETSSEGRAWTRDELNER